MTKLCSDETRYAVIGALDIMAEYRALGLRFASDRPRASGKIEAYAHGREDNRPSAWVDCNTGQYGDSGGDKKTLSLFDFAIKAGRFQDFKTAFHHYANKAGVQLTSKPKTDSPEIALEFREWDDGYDTMLAIWCVVHKPGTSPEAVKRAGGRIARYKCWVDKEGKRHIGRDTVLALPCFGPGLTNVDPVAWVVWQIGGGMLEVYRGNGQPPDYVKMKSVGPTYGTLMNREAVQHLASGATCEEAFIKTEGPSDMLALMTTIPSEQRALYLPLTNGGGATADVPPSQAKMFAGRKLWLVHDADQAGDRGISKWLDATYATTAETRVIRLPYRCVEKHGLDLRDWLNGVDETEAAKLATPL